MEAKTEIENRLSANRNYSGKLTFKHYEAMKIKASIAEMIDDNFDYRLPIDKNDFKTDCHHYENAIAANDSFPFLLKFYYALGAYNLSIGSLFQNDGKLDTYTLAHIFSKHRLDPVWNWRKSQLIRKIYKDYIKDNFSIIENYTPIHCVFTLKHDSNGYNNKQFYYGELIKYMKDIREYGFWEKYVFAGEYGLETTKNENGYHIHAHSLIFINGKINNFREQLKKNWEKLTGSSMIWAESLYFYKKDNKGNYIMTLTDGKKHSGTFDEEGNYYGEFDKILVRKKFYIKNEVKELKKNYKGDELTDKKIDLYISGILECIKYHFKSDLIKDNSGNVDFFATEEILEQTFRKRLYSRFGAFYNEKKLSFNQIEEGGEDIISGPIEKKSINSFTMQEIETEKATTVLFHPYKQKRKGKLDNYKLINNTDLSIYTILGENVNAKEIVKKLFKK